MRFIVAIATSILMGLSIAPPVLAGAGDALGGAHTGCAPSDSLGLKCGTVLAKGLGKFDAAVIGCHITEAGHAFQSGAQNGFSNAEANCEDGQSNTSATAKFDGLMTKLGVKGCAAGPIAGATSRRDTLSAPPPGAGSLNTLNASFFCDGTDAIDEDGNPSGVIATSDAFGKCEIAVAKAYRKLAYTIHKCHGKLAAYVFKGADPSAFVAVCEGEKGIDRYNASIQGLVDAGLCPQCIADNYVALGSQAVADIDAQTNEIFPCPAP